MKPLATVYTVAMPWYEEADFARLWALAHDRDEMPADHAVWRAHAEQALAIMLAAGRAVQIVTIRPEPFLAWLADRSLPNSAASRRRYVEEIALKGCAALEMAHEA